MAGDSQFSEGFLRGRSRGFREVSSVRHLALLRACSQINCLHPKRRAYRKAVAGVNPARILIPARQVDSLYMPLHLQPLAASTAGLEHSCQSNAQNSTDNSRGGDQKRYSEVCFRQTCVTGCKPLRSSHGSCSPPFRIIRPKPTFAAAEAASDLDQFYGQMLFSNRNYCWARLLSLSNVARWKCWAPQTKGQRAG